MIARANFQQYKVERTPVPTIIEDDMKYTKSAVTGGMFCKKNSSTQALLAVPNNICIKRHVKRHVER
jgi:hypothetical protein